MHLLIIVRVNGVVESMIRREKNKKENQQIQRPHRKHTKKMLVWELSLHLDLLCDCTEENKRGSWEETCRKWNKDGCEMSPQMREWPMPGGVGSSYPSRHWLVWRASWSVTNPVWTWADRHHCLKPFPAERQRAVPCLSQPESESAEKNLHKIWEERMKFKSYSRVRACLCYFNPVIGAPCSCWFLSAALCWKGQTASLNALSGCRAPERGTSSRDPRQIRPDKPIHRLWRYAEGGRHTGRGGTMLTRTDGYRLLPQLCAMTSQCTEPILANRVPLVVGLQSANPVLPGNLESMTSTWCCGLTPRGWVTDGVSWKQESPKKWLEKNVSKKASQKMSLQIKGFELQVGKPCGARVQK